MGESIKIYLQKDLEELKIHQPIRTYSSKEHYIYRCPSTEHFSVVRISHEKSYLEDGEDVFFGSFRNYTIIIE